MGMRVSGKRASRMATVSLMGAMAAGTKGASRMALGLGLARRGKLMGICILGNFWRGSMRALAR